MSQVLKNFIHVSVENTSLKYLSYTQFGNLSVQFKTSSVVSDISLEVLENMETGNVFSTWLLTYRDHLYNNTITGTNDFIVLHHDLGEPY